MGYIFLPQGQTLTADLYYINNILEKEVKTVLHRKNVNEATDKRKLFISNHHMTFVQDGAPAHAAKATQAWCEKKPAKCYRENMLENLWSIMDEVVYKEPTPKTMNDLKRRLKQASKKIQLSTPRLIPLHATTASERDNKQRRACWKLTFQIHVLSKAINFFKKFHAKVLSHVIRGTNFCDNLYIQVRSF